MDARFTPDQTFDASIMSGIGPDTEFLEQVKRDRQSRAPSRAPSRASARIASRAPSTTGYEEPDHEEDSGILPDSAADQLHKAKMAEKNTQRILNEERELNEKNLRLMSSANDKAAKENKALKETAARQNETITRQEETIAQVMFQMRDLSNMVKELQKKQPATPDQGYTTPTEQTTAVQTKQAPREAQDSPLAQPQFSKTQPKVSAAPHKETREQLRLPGPATQGPHPSGNLQPCAPPSHWQQPPMAPQTPRGPSLPALGSFSGKKSEYGNWVRSARAKLRVDGHTIGTNNHADYIWASLATGAQDLVRDWLNNQERSGSQVTGEQLLAYLDKRFTDPHQEIRAQRELSQLKQRDNEPLTDFIIRFEKITRQAGIEQDGALRSYLRGALAHKYIVLLYTVKPAETYEEFTEQLDIIAANMAADFRPQETEKRPKAPEDRDWRTNAQGNGSRKEPQRSNYRGTNYNNSNRERAKFVSPDVVEQRRQEGACIRCGTHGHDAIKCRLAPPSIPRPTGAAVRALHTKSQEEIPNRITEISDDEEKEPKNSEG